MRRAVRAGLLAWLALAAWTAPASARSLAARVRVSVAPVFFRPNRRAEQVTEVLLWGKVIIRRMTGGWAQVLVPDQYRTPRGYPGWMPRRSLIVGVRPPTGSVRTVRVARTALRARPSALAPVVTWAFLGTRLPLAPVRGGAGWTAVRLPGRRRPVWAASRDLVLESPAADGQQVVDTARQLLGTSYLWGGMSCRGIDCSGLVYAAFRVNGYTLPRDADQQFEVGKPVAKQALEPGDLVFFGPSPGKINHVGISMGGERFLQSAGHVGVSVGSLADPSYRCVYRGARRILVPGAVRLQVERP